VTSDELGKVDAELLTRWPESQIDPTLDRIRDLVDLLGHPEKSYPVIQIAGTNGKTSVARMVDELLQELNLRTGRMTSPHLESVTERINVDNVPISNERFVEVYREMSPFLDIVDERHDNPMSYFEVVTIIGFAAFADAPVDVAVAEVGLGGSWDSTNVVDAAVAVVTPIDIDHTEYLGDSIEAIAGEKAGIIKPGSFAILAAQRPEAAEVLMARVAEVGATVAREGVEFGVRGREIAVGGQMLSLQGLTGPYDEVFLPLHGEHQAHNAAVALAAVEAFAGGGREGLDPDAVRAAFARVRSPGRLEPLRRGPLVLVDAAHNPAGAAALAAALTEEFAGTTFVAVLAVLSDKDATGILEELEPVVAGVVATTNSSPRALPPDDLARAARAVFGDDRVFQASPLPEAIEIALTLAEREAPMGGNGVIITGSVVTAGDARRVLGAES
jgi:dihydrofolate synthase/folylpolyglutamate synthase